MKKNNAYNIFTFTIKYRSEMTQSKGANRIHDKTTKIRIQHYIGIAIFESKHFRCFYFCFDYTNKFHQFKGHRTLAYSIASSIYGFHHTALQVPNMTCKTCMHGHGYCKVQMYWLKCKCTDIIFSKQLLLFIY